MFPSFSLSSLSIVSLTRSPPSVLSFNNVYSLLVVFIPLTFDTTFNLYLFSSSVLKSSSLNIFSLKSIMSILVDISFLGVEVKCVKSDSILIVEFSIGVRKSTDLKNFA